MLACPPLAQTRTPATAGAQLRPEAHGLARRSRASRAGGAGTASTERWEGKLANPSKPGRAHQGRKACEVGRAGSQSKACDGGRVWTESKAC